MNQNNFISAIKKINVGQMFETARLLNPYFLFYKLNGVIPCKINFTDINKVSLLRAVRKQFPDIENDIISSVCFYPGGREIDVNSALIALKKDIFIYIGAGEYQRYEHVVLIHSPHYKINDLKPYKNFILKHCVKETFDKPLVHLLYLRNYELALKKFDTKLPAINLTELYNDDLLPIHNIIIDRMRKETEKGILLLHGKPGTGKTTYIKYLTSLLKKRVIYFPLDIIDIIGNPKYMDFIFEMKNSVFVIEDAEDIIASRKNKTSAAISTILNLTDGILADCLGIQVICSFNTELSEIDSALLRKGRLIARYEFKPLAKVKSQYLVEKLGIDQKINKEMTLAEIYNFNDKSFDVDRRRIGF